VAAALRGRLTWCFDVFELAAACAAAGPACPGPLVTLAAVLFEDAGLRAAFDIPEPVLLAFFAAVQAGYLRTAYHNALHATDVLHGLNYILLAGGVGAPLSRVELMAALLAAAVHDVGHPGVSNAFLVAAGAPLALRYNDVSVLENYHCATACALLARPECNLTARMAPEEARALRRQLVSLVLSTDMAQHEPFMAETAQRLAAPGGLAPVRTDADRGWALRLALKCADISNAAKPVAGAVRWGVAILAEHSREAGLERVRGMRADSSGSHAAGSVTAGQLTFLDAVARPLYEALGALAPALAVPAAARIRRTAAFYGGHAAPTPAPAP
jgi:cAMP-specific phosphodiesterase 4